ncbi:MAG: SpoIIE family protein phosphatase [Chloroflexi bacterium]|nr:SpoIIE family protein phosphatase [Chloroflexota bacterium]
MKALLLKRLPLFAALPDADVQALADAMRTLALDTGTLMLHEGDVADRFFVLAEGEVDVIKALGTSDERLLAVRGPGAFIGEMGLLNPERQRTASVRARTPVQMYEMTRADFETVLHRHPLIAYEMVRVVSSRLQESENETVASLRQKNAELTRAYEDLKAAQAQIIEKERLERELQVAREIQQSILPHTLPQMPGFDFDARMIPSRAVGGDFYDFVPLAGGRLGIAIGDVSDKGVPAAIFMALARSLLRAEAFRADAPDAVLRNVNRLLLDMNDAGMFVTMLYGVLDGASHRFEYVRAGHERPAHVGAQGACDFSARMPGQPLGLLPTPALTRQTVDLVPGSTLVLYTDGVTDTMNTQQQPFGAERLCAALASLHGEPVHTLCDDLIGALDRYRAAAPQHDDIALVALRAR